MHRRDFSRGLLATGLSSPLILSSGQGLANQRDDRGPDALDPLGRVLLVIGVRQIVIEFMLILNPVLIGVDLRRPVPQFNEARAAADKLPLLGGLFRQPLQKRFAGASVVGQIFLIRNLLLILPLAAPILHIRNTVIAHRDRSWEPPKPPAEVRMSRVPTAQEVRNTGRLSGEVLRRKNDLLLLLSPTEVERHFF